jgi:hypothetical protein
MTRRPAESMNRPALAADAINSASRMARLAAQDRNDIVLLNETRG